jgi:zinc/manganese transport system substrate-binding protein
MPRRLPLPAVLATVGLVAALLGGRAAAGAPAPLQVVAAENVYGDVAAQIGGADVRVTSILSNPEADPHLFQVSPSVGRAVAAARIVVINGIGYDAWMDRLLEAAKGGGGRRVLVVAALAGRKAGDNPHLWYDPAVMRAYARALAEALAAEDPAHVSAYRQRLDAFEASLEPVEAQIAALHARLAGVPVTATEPVLGLLFAALGLAVRNQSFQIAVMNGTEPSATDVAAFEDDLRSRRVRLLAYNSQATEPIAAHMERLARASGVPVVGVAEAEPPGTRYQAWMKDVLEALAKALLPQ